MTTLPRFCRFCLEEISGTFLFLKSEDSLKHGTLGRGICFEPILASNFPDINTSLTKWPVVCRKCTDQFMFASLFKFKLSETEDKIQKAMNVTNTKRVNLRLLVRTEFRRSKLICRTCLSIIKGGKFRPVHGLAGELDQLIVRLIECFPKINFKISDNPVICQSCIFESDRYYRFRKKCYETEKLLTHFFKNHSIEFDSIDLAEVIGEIKENKATTLRMDLSLMNIVQDNCLIPLSRPGSKSNNEVKTYSPMKIRTSQEKRDPLESDLSVSQESTESIDYRMSENIEKEINLNIPFIDYQSVEDTIKREINLDPLFPDTTPLADPLTIMVKEEHECEPEEEEEVNERDEEEAIMSVSDFAECYIKDEPTDDAENDAPEYVQISDALLYSNDAPTEVQNDEAENSEQKCIKTCLKCLDTDSKCSHTKKDLIWYTCSLCSYQTHWKHHLTRHKLIHDKQETKDKLFHCRSCNFKSAFKHCVMRHNALTHARAFKCPECSFATQFKFTLTEHIKTTHRTSEDLHKCPECSYTSKWKYHIKRHMFRHSFK